MNVPKNPKSYLSPLSSISMLIPTTVQRSLELRQSMQDIHRWLSNRLVTSDPDGKKTEPTLSTSCANAFIKDLATAIKQECNV